MAAPQVLRNKHDSKLSAFGTALDDAREKFGVTDLLASKYLYAKPGEVFLERYGELINLSRAGKLDYARAAGGPPASYRVGSADTYTVLSPGA